MTQQPPGDGGYPPDPRYPEPAQPPADGGYAPDPRYPEPAQPPGGYAEPQYLPPPPYPPGQEPLQPRNGPRRRSPMVAPALALLGLLLVGVVSIWAIGFLNSTLDEAAAAEASIAPGAGAAAVVETTEPARAEETSTPEPVGAEATTTPEPEAVESLGPPVIIQAPPGESADVKGSIVFTRNGDIWSASGSQLRRLTDTKSTRSDSSPSWTPDGKHIYFIRTSQKETDKTRPGGKYTLTPTNLERIKADGSGRKTIYESLIQDQRGFWFTHVLQPSASDNGVNVAVVSDGADGSGPVILHVVNSRTGRLRKVPIASDGDLGHNDPAFSPDGARIAYTYNQNQGSDGVPRVGIFTCQSRNNCSQGKGKLLKAGFANPSWSPNGNWLAVEETSGTGRNIAIIGVRNGDVKAHLTEDGNSFAPVFSPDGDQVAYLRRDGTKIDLRIMTLDIDGRGNISLVSDRAITTDGGVDGASSPSWYIPKSQLTNPQPDVDSVDLADGVGVEATQAPATDDSDADEGAPPPPGS